MSSPIVIHLYRPYASEEEYILHERFSIEAKSMLLIDQPHLPIDTAVVFDVTLDNGQKPIRAEARVVGHVEPEGDRPGGLRVRFRRFGAATKAFIDRAVNGSCAPDVAAVASGNAALAAATVAASSPALDVVKAGAHGSDVTTDVAPDPAPLLTTGPSQSVRTDADEASGIHRKTGASPVAVPADREALLARLRGRRVG